MHETVERPLQNFFQPLGLLAVSHHGKSGLLYWQRIIKLIHKLELIDVNFSPLSPGIGSVALSIDSYTIIDFSEKLLVCSTTHNARARVRRFRNSMIEWCGIVILLSSIEHTHDHYQISCWIESAQAAAAAAPHVWQGKVNLVQIDVCRLDLRLAIHTNCSWKSIDRN